MCASILDMVLKCVLGEQILGVKSEGYGVICLLRRRLAPSRLQPGETQTEVVGLDHAGNQKKIDDPANGKQPAGTKPDNPGDSLTAVKTVNTQKAKKQPK